MMTREEYLDNGPKKIEIDFARLQVTVPGKKLSDKDISKIPVELRKGEVTEDGREIYRVPNPDYSWKKDLEAAAEATCRNVAPTVTEEDFTHQIPDVARKQMIRNMDRDGLDRAKISRMAMVHEMTPECHYWSGTLEQSGPILSAIRERAKRHPSDPRHQRLGTAAQTIVDLHLTGCEHDNIPVGTLDAVESFGTIFNEDRDMSKHDREVVASHFIANMRTSNRYARRFEKAVKGLPQEADGVVAHMREWNKEPLVMFVVDRFSGCDKKTLDEYNRASLKDVAREVRSELADTRETPKGEVVKAKACLRFIKEVTGDPSQGRAARAKLSAANSLAMSLHPLGEAQQTPILIHEITRAEIEKSERMIPKSLKGILDR